MTPRCLARLGLGALLLVASLPAAAQQSRPSSLTRERGAVYVEDFTDQPVKLTLPEAAPAFADLSARRRLGQLLGGQKVELIAFSDKACRVRGRAAHDTIVGWVGLKNLKADDPELFDRLKEAAARRAEVEKLIARKEAAIGMTPDEVIRALGRPDEETSNVRQEGSTGSFSYVTYDRIPQRTLVRDRYGRLVQTITYIKVETGRLTVEFDNGSVASLQSTKGRPNWNNSRLVVPPIDIW
jgi:hypothetical protein